MQVVISYWPAVALAFIIINAITVAFVVGLFWRQQRQQKNQLAIKTLLNPRQHQRRRTQRLFRILMHSHSYRVEALWKRLTPADITQLLRTDIPAKLRRLAKRGSKWQRTRAMLLLGLLQDVQALGLLRQLVFNTDYDLSSAAIAALGRFNDPQVAVFMIGLLSSRYGLSGSRIASVLEGMQLDLSEPLLATLELSDTKSRFWAATLLGRYATDKVRAALVRHLALADDEPNTRAAILDSLGKMGDLSCAMSVVQALQDPVWFVRAHAALACGQMQLVSAVPLLIRGLGDPNWWVRWDSMRAIETLLRHDNSGMTRDKLFAAIDDEDNFTRNGIAAIACNAGLVQGLVQQLQNQSAGKADASRLLNLIEQAGGAVATAALLQTSKVG